MPEPVEVKQKRTKRFVRKIEPETESQGFTPSMPTCGNDLIGLWDLPPEAVTQAMLKIGRTIPMSSRLELVRDCTVQDYSLESVAHAFGPGEYMLVLNPGPMKAWGGRSVRIMVSKEYSRECGWSPYSDPPPAPSVPRFAELRSIQESARTVAEGGAFTPQVMAQLIETAIERTAERFKPQAPADPMGMMGPMVQMMTFITTIQKGAMDQAMALAGLKAPKVEEDPEDDSWPGVIREALPTLAELAKGFMSRITPPAPQPQGQTIEPEPEGEPVSVPLSQDEINQFLPMVAMLKPHAALIVKLVSMKEPSDAAAELAAFIPSPLQDSMIRYSDLVKKRGKDVLGLIDPGLVTDKGFYTVIGIGAILREV